MRVVCLSDTHDRQDNIVVPDGDLLIHSGDLTMAGDEAAARAGIKWLASLPHARKLFVPGNHDLAFQNNANLLREFAGRLPSVQILIDRTTRVAGLRVYGSPWTPGGKKWAFAYNSHHPTEPAGIWAKIPDDVDILVTHVPPGGIGDLTMSGRRLGCAALRTRLRKLPQLKLHAFGHVHESHGLVSLRGVDFVNGAICDARYHAAHAPILVDLPIDFHEGEARDRQRRREIRQEALLDGIAIDFRDHA